MGHPLTTETVARHSDLDVGLLLGASFPSPDLARVAADSLSGSEPMRGGRNVVMREGPAFSVEVTPGVVQLRAQDLARLERRKDRPALPPGTGRSRITEWSPKSRANMVRKIASADYAPLLRRGVPVMVTLTYPGDWLEVAADPRRVKRHLFAFRRAWFRRWGSQPVGIWKLEFQRRGAPHFHLLVPAPATLKDLTLWVAETWNSIVDHPDPEQRRRHLLAGTGVDVAAGARMRDPRRVAVYFLKHGVKSHDGKEYQNVAPTEWGEYGPGRFWGIWGLNITPSRVYVDARTFVALRRLMRRWAHANNRRGMCGGSLTGGWFAVNDGPAFAFALSRALALADN